MTKEEISRLEPGTQVDVTLCGERSGPYTFVRVQGKTENEELVYVQGESNYVFTKERISLHVPATNTTPTGFRKFGPYDRVEKIKGSSWRGKVVGFYSTSLTPEGYAVESQYEPGSVQLYPVDALKLQGEK